MQDLVNVTGMILKSEPIGEYDRRVVILTKERGKVSAFVRGARRPGNRFMAATNPFCFGEFKLYPGKNAYTLQDIHITNFFEELRNDFVGAYYDDIKNIVSSFGQHLILNHVDSCSNFTRCTAFIDGSSKKSVVNFSMLETVTVNHVAPICFHFNLLE